MSTEIDSITAQVTPVSCFLESDGAIDITVWGGIPPYTFFWNDGNFQEDRLNLPAGNYGVTVHDQDGHFAIASYTLAQPAPLYFETTVTPVACYGGNDGAIDIDVYGGTPPYFFLWSDGSTTEDLSGLTAGIYTLLLTDANDCLLSGDVLVPGPAPTYTLSVATQDVSCAGGSDGTIDLIVNGGISPYTYYWNDGFTGEDRDGLPAGFYSVSVYDAEGVCSATSASLVQPLPITIVSEVIEVNCSGVSNGSILIDISGGTPPYSFFWSNAANTQSLIGIGAGTYNLNVLDFNGCIAQAGPFVLTNPAPISTNYTQQDVSCFGGSDGTIDLSVSGGFSPYTFVWSNGAVTEDLEGISQGFYAVTITDSVGCTANQFILISEPESMLSNAQVFNITCFGQVNGIIILSTTGGTPPYSFNWSNGSTLDDQFNLHAGTYTVTITDTEGCSLIESHTIIEPAFLWCGGLITDINCPGDQFGGIELGVFGGTEPYSYLWNDGPTTKNRSNIPAGTYSVTVTDANNCTYSTYFVVEDPDDIVFQPLIDHVSCHGLSDATIDLNMGGGTPPFTYAWSTGASTEDIGGLPIGFYSVSVTDANGCLADTTIEITQPDPLQITGTAYPALCFDSIDGEIACITTGGTPPYTWLWSDGDTMENNKYLAAGAYSVTVTDDHGCTASADFIVEQPLPISYNETITHVSCFGLSDGSIVTNPSGGTAPFTYLWSTMDTLSFIDTLTSGLYSLELIDAHGCINTTVFTVTQPDILAAVLVPHNVNCFEGTDGYIEVTTSGGTQAYNWSWNTGATSEDLSNLVAGQYFLTVTDAMGCQYIDSTTLTQPDAIVASGATTDNICYGDLLGTITLAVEGGVSPYTYLWNDGSPLMDRTGLGAGAYSVTITDSQACNKVLDFVILEPTQITSVETITNISCNGAGDGSISVIVSGGTPEYTLLWSTGSGLNMIENLLPGTYNLTVTDQNLCSRTFTYDITQPDVLQASGVITNISCNGENDGNIAVNVSGGTTPYIYSWTNGAATLDPGPLAPGPYTLTVTDANACSTTADFLITQPDPLQIVALLTQITCVGAHNGIIDVSVFGGTGPYTYQWNTGDMSEDLFNVYPDTYFLTLTDAHLCTTTGNFTISDPSLIVTVTAQQDSVSCYGGSDGGIDLAVSGGSAPYTYAWSTGSTDENLTGVGIGTYTVTVTESGGACTVISETVLEPEPLSVSHISTPASCHGSLDGSIDITVSGGTPAYDFNWSDGSDLEDLSLAGAGNYTVTITDANNCELIGEFTIGQPDTINYLVDIVPLSCKDVPDGQVNLTTQGGTAPYSWLWSNGETTESISLLDTGTYTVTITDSHTCIFSASFYVTEPDSLLLITDQVVDVLCHNGSDGSISLSTTGGTPGYTYLWSDGADTEDRTGLSTGEYSVTVSDVNGCAFTSSFLINEIIVINIESYPTNPSCYGYADGLINIDIAGGTSPLEYLWSNGSLEEDILSLTAGVYTLSVTDANGCTEAASIILTDPDSVMVTGLVNPVSCYGLGDGMITTTTTGGNGDYNWQWSSGQNTDVITNLTPGPYTVTATDILGCTTTATFEVTQPDPVSGTIGPLNQTIYCNGTAISPILFTPEFYPASLVSYTWTRNQAANVVGMPLSGTGVVEGTLTNVTTIQQTVVFTIHVYTNNCFSGMYNAVILIRPSIDISFTHPPILCAGDTVLLSIQALGGNPPYTGIQNINLTAGTYDFTVTDAQGCSVTESITLSEPPPIVLSGTAFPAYCSNQTNAAINLNASGGTGTLTYLWQDGSTAQNRNSLATGLYSVTVTDANACTATTSFNVGAWYPAPLGYMAASPAGCYGQSNPIYVYLAGTPPFSFTYTDGTNTYAVTNVMTNAYTINVMIYDTITYELLTIHDLYCAGEVTSYPQTLYPKTPPTVSLVAPAPICKNETSQITVNLTGTPPFSLTWFDGTAHLVTNILASPYIITSTPQQTKQYSITSMSDAYCPATSLSTPVNQIVYPLPTATITGNPTVCSGLTVPLLVQLTGTPPWSFTYTDGTNTNTVSMILSPTYTLMVTPLVTTSYSLVAVNDNRCDGTVSGLATVLVHPRPTATWVGPDSACFNGVVTLDIVLTGSPPWSLTWNDGTAHYVPNIMFSPYTISAGMQTTKTFTITQLADAFCQAITADQLGQPKTVSVHQLPTATLSGPPYTCFGLGGFLEVELTGTPPWSVSWYEGTQIHTAGGIETSPFEIPIDPATTTNYFLSSVSDDFCIGNILGTPVSVTVTPSPILEIVGFQEENPVCSGSDLSFTLHFTDGLPPFTLTYFDSQSVFHSVENLIDGSVLTFPAPGDEGSYAYILMSVSGANGCEQFFNQNFTIQVIPAPSIDAGQDTIVPLGTSISLNGSISGGVPPYQVLWQPGLYLDDSTSLNPTCTPLAAISYSLMVTDSIGCTVYDQVFVDIDLSRNIYGYVTYANDLSTPMNNARIEVRNSLNEIIDSTFTLADGYYSFTDLPNGNLHLRGFTDKPYGGVNSTDALVILKHFVQIQTLTGIRLYASDVDASGYVNAIDALAVAKRFTGQISSFVIGDWYFESPSFSVPSSVAQINFQALCSGDANASYYPSAKHSSNIRLESNDELYFTPGQLVDIPLSSATELEMGALSLVIEYPTELLDIQDIKMLDGSPVQFKVQDNQIRVSWYQVKAMQLSASAPFMSITAHVRAGMQESSAGFTIHGESELADAAGKPQAEAIFLVPKFRLLTGNHDFQLSNHPNPFSLLSQITYSLPLDGHVEINILDISGKQIRKLLDQEQQAGNHQLLFDAADLPEGMYFYTLTCQSKLGLKKLSRKMSIIR